MSKAPDETMEWVWAAKRKISKDIEGMTPEEIGEYFKERAGEAREKISSLQEA